MTNFIVGLKIEEYTSIAECAKIVRSFNNASIAEFKKCISTHSYVLCYSCTDDLGLKNIIACYEELVKSGAKVSLYELDHRPTTIELLRNRASMYKDIAEDIDRT